MLQPTQARPSGMGAPGRSLGEAKPTCIPSRHSARGATSARKGNSLPGASLSGRDEKLLASPVSPYPPCSWSMRQNLGGWSGCIPAQPHPAWLCVPVNFPQNSVSSPVRWGGGVGSPSSAPCSLSKSPVRRIKCLPSQQLGVWDQVLQASATRWFEDLGLPCSAAGLPRSVVSALHVCLLHVLFAPRA